MLHLHGESCKDGVKLKREGLHMWVERGHRLKMERKWHGIVVQFQRSSMKTQESS